MISTPFVPVPPPAYGGTELVVGVLIEGLIARGHDVTLYATGDSQPPCRLRWVYEGSVWPPEATVELTHTAFAYQDILARGGADVIHAHTPPAIALAPFARIPTVYTIHHVRQETLCDLYRTSGGERVTMVAISERQRELVADSCASRVVYHGLDVSGYGLGAGAGGYVAFLGRFAREKGVHSAIDAARRAGVPIRLAGRPHMPKDEGYFNVEVKPRLGKPGVLWQGEASQLPKVALLAGATALLAPIDWEEPFGLAIIEAMLCGTPVIAFGRGSVPEIVDEGLTGFVVNDVDEMAARILALRRGGFDRVRCREHAVRRFSADRMVEDYLAVYEEVAGLGAASGEIAGAIPS